MKAKGYSLSSYCKSSQLRFNLTKQANSGRVWVASQTTTIEMQDSALHRVGSDYAPEIGSISCLQRRYDRGEARCPLAIWCLPRQVLNVGECRADIRGTPLYGCQPMSKPRTQYAIFILLFVVALIVAAIPITVLVLSALFLKERLSLLALTGIAISFVGAVLLVVGDPETRWALEGPMLGDLLIFGAVTSMAFYTIIMKRMIQSHSALDVTGLQICYGALLFAPALLWESP